MKKTHLVVLLDRSGSMQTNLREHEGGLRDFVDKQRGFADVYMTFIRFDGNNPFDLVFNRQLISTVSADDLKINPRGMTPLYDAIGKACHHIDSLKEDDDVILLIITDGIENDSREYKIEKVRELISGKRGDGWQVVFLGGDIDAASVSASVGISGSSAAKFTNTNASVVYRSLGNKLSTGHSLKANSLTQEEATNALIQATTFTDEERESYNSIAQQ